MKTIIPCLVLAAALLCWSDGSPKTAEITDLIHWDTSASSAPAIDGDLLEKGREVFEKQCARCHGSRGDGQGKAVKILKNKPRDLTGGVFKFRTTRPDGLPCDADLFRTMSDGLPAYGMPMFDTISEADRWATIAHLKVLVAASLLEHFEEAAKKEGTPFDPAEAKKQVADRIKSGTPVEVPVEPGGPDAGAVERGLELFNDEQRFQCATCHGPAGKGDGPRAGGLKDDWGMDIRPRDLTQQRAFRRSGWKPEDTIRRIITGIPGTPMPSHPDASARDLWDIARFVESLAAPEEGK